MVSYSLPYRLEPLSGKIQSVTELIPDQHFTSKSAKPSEEQNQSGKGESSSADVEVESSAEHTMAGGKSNKN